MKNDLNYFLAGGTLIGAIRHKGYIPWDDDIDVIMPRPDYIKFINLTKQGLGPYVVKGPYNIQSKFDPPYHCTYCKICDDRTELIEFPKTKHIVSSVYIDVFPCDGLPSDFKSIAKHYKKARIYIKLNALLNMSYYRKNMTSNTIKKIFWSLIFLIKLLLPDKIFFRKIEKLATKYDYNKSEFVGVIVAGYGLKEHMPKKVFESYILGDFEGKKFRIPVGYDIYLSKIYGNYMELPPKNKRVGHDSIAFLK